MLRQLRDALRFAIADFFDVPVAGVLTMLALIAVLVALVTIRTTTTMLETGGLRTLVGIAALLLLVAAGQTIRRR